MIMLFNTFVELKVHRSVHSILPLPGRVGHTMQGDGLPHNQVLAFPIYLLDSGLEKTTYASDPITDWITVVPAGARAVLPSLPSSQGWQILAHFGLG
jgi:hypothetical protein